MMTNQHTMSIGHVDSWTIISQMKKKRFNSLAVALGEDSLLVVGGWSPKLLHSETHETNI